MRPDSCPCGACRLMQQRFRNSGSKSSIDRPDIAKRNGPITETSGSAEPGSGAVELGRARAEVRHRDGVEMLLRCAQDVVQIVLLFIDIEQVGRQLALSGTLAYGQQRGVGITRVVR